MTPCLCRPWSEGSVFQSPPALTVPAARSVTLSYNFSTSGSFPYLFWYRQLTHQPPQMLIQLDRSQLRKELGQVSAELHVGNYTAPLVIWEVTLQDSAGYLYALREGSVGLCTKRGGRALDLCLH